MSSRVIFYFVCFKLSAVHAKVCVTLCYDNSMQGSKAHKYISWSEAKS
jgi:hypothetical protein